MCLSVLCAAKPIRLLTGDKNTQNTPFVESNIKQLLSVAVIAVGGILLANIGDFDLSGGDQNVQIFPIVLIVIGVASFLISFFGCCGAIRESACLIYTVNGGA